FAAPMEKHDENKSDCEVVSENEAVSKNVQKPKKDGETPCAASDGDVFNHWECGVLKGAFLHMRYASHILNLDVKDGLTNLTLPIKKKFVLWWNSTYLMLESAVKFKKVFSNLLLKDSSCEKEMKKCEGGLIHEDGWISVTSLLPFLKIFYEATLRFSGSRYVTSNAYVHEIFGVGTVIDGFTTNQDSSIYSMAFSMKQKYIKCEYHQYSRPELEALFELYENSMPKKQKSVEASSSSKTSIPSMASSDNQTTIDIDEIMSKRFEIAIGSSETSMRESELEKYLGEDREPKDSRFDILQWWKVQQC
ncbi:zinc finger BED domain-containing protein RICESLEEPER 1-like, partial [Bidens hawaiensis]|uniref:zinc finger BED domain-containing protein RICESLEEPER 1-like n=1 Tax=Bidens hawaiensis TaxID=980011 RepID=UPI004048F8B1